MVDHIDFMFGFTLIKVNLRRTATQSSVQSMEYPPECTATHFPTRLPVSTCAVTHITSTPSYLAHMSLCFYPDNRYEFIFSFYNPLLARPYSLTLGGMQNDLDEAISNSYSLALSSSDNLR
jgi:hypothetical protein